MISVSEDHQQYGWLSNVYAGVGVGYHGRLFVSAQNLYYWLLLPAASSARQDMVTAPAESAKALGESLLIQWGFKSSEDIPLGMRMRCMTLALQAKFDNLVLKRRLFDTGQALLRYDCPDRVWGWSGGAGANLLGLLLMQQRAMDFAYFVPPTDRPADRPADPVSPAADLVAWPCMDTADGYRFWFDPFKSEWGDGDLALGLSEDAVSDPSNRFGVAYRWMPHGEFVNGGGKCGSDEVSG